MMHVTYNKTDEHAVMLQLGLEILGPEFLAQLCWNCKGTTGHKFSHCDICGRDKPYGTALGLLMGNRPAPESVVNQVLEVAENYLRRTSTVVSGKTD